MSEEIKRNIRKLPSSELRTYYNAYRKGQVYKYAYIEAARELGRRNALKDLSKEKAIKSKQRIKVLRRNPKRAGWDMGW